ncbi:DUF2637 domain-containing protein [Streptomyces zingiberis]|uniref:DUF2637 domain-containing protein n=1 Tax=Streptomyces zingiberis TaxID=2053010 RepID=A0ABX1C1K5_9ACTN|nr:DUF2637 domain-containing protein [Streptomyces zingiberis]NJQ03780.1 DUF2637 domain-containing protein [Streptomyces zingiberis]
MQLTRTHRILIGVVVAGAVLIAAIGFAGSYAAVRDLAEQKGFGAFSVVFPIGIDAGIVVLLALDLLLTWIRIPFPLLRQTAWLLTAATIAFNGAAAWPDPLGVGMHAVIPVLFVVSVEAARHAIGRIADITADKHMEGVRLSRWLLAFPSTFRLWRRMKLWELRSYDEVIRLEQDRLVYQARLRARYGRAWRRKAPVEAVMPLRLARYGVPLAETAPAGLAAAGIEPRLLPADPAPPELESATARPTTARPGAPATATGQEPGHERPAEEPLPHQEQGGPTHDAAGYPTEPAGHILPQLPPQPHRSRQEEQPQPAPVPQQRAAGPGPAPAGGQAPAVPTGAVPGGTGPGGTVPGGTDAPAGGQEPASRFQVPNGAGGTRPLGQGVQDAMPTDDELYHTFRGSIAGEGMPTARAFAANVEAAHGLRLDSREVDQYMKRFTARFETELFEDHIA